MHNTLFLALFMVFILVMLALDLGVFHKKDHEIGMKEAGLWTGVWMLLSMGMALLVYLEDGADKCTEYLAGYFLEFSLSIDNIFVMIMIFLSFGIPKQYYHRILFWGILGAIVLRFIFIFALGAVVSKFEWVLAIFGLILLWSGAKMFKGDKEEEIDTEKHPVVRFCTKYFRATPKLDGHNFFTRIDGKRHITPLFIVLMVIEFSDIIFAVDSIPAVFSVTQDTFIVYFSNIFAIMGLRSLFFLLNSVKEKFWLLSYGLGVLLCFIGLKMVLAFWPGLHVGTTASLCVILGILCSSILLSILFPKKNPKTEN